MKQLASGPRYCGSAGEEVARNICAARLQASGLTVSDETFQFSEFTGKYGVPVIGLLLLVLIVFDVHVFWSHGGAVPAFAVLALGIVAVVMIARWLTRRGVLRFPSMRRAGVNLVAARGNPKVWLVAHLDSKSQTIPMLLRIVSIVLLTVFVVLMFLSLTAEWLAELAGDFAFNEAEAFIFSSILAAIATLFLMFCLTGNRSNGAADNASGVATILLAASKLSQIQDIGILITTGEELGLAGARSFVSSHRVPAIALNCDTIDDAGGFLCMCKGRPGSAVAAVVRAARRHGLSVRSRAMLPGILADNIAFTDAGWDSLTLSRGNISTLARVHTSRDSLDHLTGTGIAQAARVLAATVEELS